MTEFEIGDAVMFNEGYDFDINYGRTPKVKNGEVLTISNKTNDVYGFKEDIRANGKAHWLKEFVEKEFVLANKLGVQSKRVD